MNKPDCVLGIDLGTSSVKLLLKYRDGRTVKARESYAEPAPLGWWRAIKKALSRLELQGLGAIGLSSQVGTYVVDNREVISWGGKEGAEELAEIREHWSRDFFLQEISMPHPNLISYPIPRLLYIKRHYPEAEKVCQPKDFLCEMLTGSYVTDPWSWRGLTKMPGAPSIQSSRRQENQTVDPDFQSSRRQENQIGDSHIHPNRGLTDVSGCTYSRICLERIGFPFSKLPEMRSPLDLAGFTKEIPIEGGVLPAGIPVFVGMNDFFASLLGMGVLEPGSLFDISGTSEHLGIVEERIHPDTELVSGPYLSGNVHYGVTASGGASLAYGMELFGYEEVHPAQNLDRNPPIFLPYINGERAPIWDADARGMFFGIHGDCRKSDMAYGVLEGVLFSLWHIYEYMGKPRADSMRVSGGAASNAVLNQMKAELFGVPVLVPKETETSALGACMTAAVGLGWFSDYREAAERFCAIRECVSPWGQYKRMLEQRFAIYKELYPATKKLLGGQQNKEQEEQTI